MDFEWSDASVRPLCPPGKPRDGSQTHPETNQRGHERGGEVHHGQGQEQCHAQCDGKLEEEREKQVTLRERKKLTAGMGIASVT